VVSRSISHEKLDNGMPPMGAGGVHNGMLPMLGEVGVRSMDIGRPMSIDIGRASDASSASALTDICCCAVAPTCARVRDARAYTLFR